MEANANVLLAFVTQFKEAGDDPGSSWGNPVKCEQGPKTIEKWNVTILI